MSANYKAEGPPNALLILFDGEDLTDEPYPVTTLNNLIAASRIPPTVAVEVGRRAIPGHVRPSFQETEKYIKGGGGAAPVAEAPAAPAAPAAAA